MVFVEVFFFFIFFHFLSYFTHFAFQSLQQTLQLLTRFAIPINKLDAKQDVLKYT